MRALALIALPLVLLALAGCGGTSSDSGTSAPGAVDVVATTTVLGDLARAVGGRDADVHQLLRANSDPHDYEPRPDDVVATAEAQLVLTSGDGLDGWMEKVVEQAGGDPRVVDVGAAAPVVRRSGGDVDPHWWHDPRNAEAAVVAIRDELARANPSARAGYTRRAAAKLRRLRALDVAIERCAATIPPARRTLVTDHDAFGYFAGRYGIRIVGTVIPSLTTQAQPSAGDLAELARTIAREHVRTVFAERSVNPKLARAIAGETHARADDSLYGDTLGAAGSDGATYLAMEAHNADAIVRGLGDERHGCPAALRAAAGGRG
ncbi:MAG TPA: metal ABC transporter substrate-binding protein [Conexibacter sp.]|nr:metal ABC transporter substrate-binding protein [Conexibacter sp.]